MNTIVPAPPTPAASGPTARTATAEGGSDSFADTLARALDPDTSTGGRGADAANSDAAKSDAVTAPDAPAVAFDPVAAPSGSPTSSSVAGASAEASPGPAFEGGTAVPTRHSEQNTVEVAVAPSGSDAPTSETGPATAPSAEGAVLPAAEVGEAATDLTGGEAVATGADASVDVPASTAAAGSGSLSTAPPTPEHATGGTRGEPTGATTTGTPPDGTALTQAAPTGAPTDAQTAAAATAAGATTAAGGVSAPAQPEPSTQGASAAGNGNVPAAQTTTAAARPQGTSAPHIDAAMPGAGETAPQSAGDAPMTAAVAGPARPSETAVGTAATDRGRPLVAASGASRTASRAADPVEAGTPVGASPTGAGTPATASSAAPAPASAPAPPPAPLGAQILPGMLQMARSGNGDHTMTIRVAPDSLGPVTVHAQISDSGVQLSISAPTPDGHDALKQILTELRRDLAGSGLSANLELGDPDGGAASYRDDDGDGPALGADGPGPSPTLRGTDTVTAAPRAGIEIDPSRRLDVTI